MLQTKEIFRLLNKRERINFCILMFLMLLNSVFEILGISSIIPIISITIKNDLSLFERMFFYDQIKHFSQRQDFILLSFLFVGAVFVLKNLFISYYNYFLSKFQCEIVERISNDVYFYYLHLQYKDYLELKTSKLIYDTTEAIEVFRANLLNLSSFLLETIVLSIILIFLISLNPTSTLLTVLLLAALSFSFFYFFGRQNFFLGSQVKKGSKNRINILNMSFGSIKDIKIYSGETFFYNKFKLQNYFLNIYQKIYLFFLSLPKPFFEALIVVILLASLYYFLKILNISYDIIILNLAIFAVSMFRIYPSIYRIAACFQKGSFGKAVLNDLTDLYQKKKIFNNFVNNDNLFEDEKVKSLILKNIEFKYPQKKQPTLKKINLELEKNKFIGIKGETGAGKSTLVDVITGLLRPQYGKFILNNKEIAHLPNDWQKNISYVPQNISLIDDTLERNIALAINDEKIDKEKIHQVIKLSQLDTFTKDNRVLGERGLQVSGGEKQRIGIARALYYDRSIYIFDEATNALDESTEKLVLENLKNHLKDKFIIIISHKSSTLSFCDKIFSFYNGELKLI